jgi:hypothetical protein
MRYASVRSVGNLLGAGEDSALVLESVLVFACRVSVGEAERTFGVGTPPATWLCNGLTSLTAPSVSADV